jgi:hypothetical protein
VKEYSRTGEAAGDNVAHVHFMLGTKATNTCTWNR